MSEHIKSIINDQKAFFDSGASRSVSFRIEQLIKLKKLVVDHTDILINALTLDLQKPIHEAYTTEIALILQEIDHALKNIHLWTAERYVKTPFFLKPAKSAIIQPPRGRILIIAPWNYPLLLTLLPTIGALAAGNCIIIKPSEYAPHTSNSLAHLINNNFNTALLYVIQGDAQIAEQLLNQQWDYIFFTGNASTGKKIMVAAAKHITPVSLELGGKCPVIVHNDADIHEAAQKIVWGKYLNAGQSCIAPDYALVHNTIKQNFTTTLIHTIKKFYGNNPEANLSYGRIINKYQIDRISKLISNVEIIHGGTIREKTLYIEPTLVHEPPLNHPIMTDEIFGPILPIIGYDEFDEALHIVNSKESPLAVYIFTQQQPIIDMLIRQTNSGSVCNNDIVVQITSPYLPFGGVGQSGFGSYHGKATFNLFSHNRTIFYRTCRWDIMVRYPPYGWMHIWYRKFLQWWLNGYSKRQ